MKKNVLFLIAIPLMLSACKGNTSSIAPSSSTNSSSEQSSITQESSSSEPITSYQDSCSMCIGLTSSASSSSEAFSSSTSSSSSKASSSSQVSSSSSASSSQANSSSNIEEPKYNLEFRSTFMKDEDNNPINLSYDIPYSYFSFEHSSSTFNKELAIASLPFVVAAPDKNELRSTYDRFGFNANEIVFSSDYEKEEDENTLLYAIGHKKVGSRDLVNITISGYMYSKPWESNFKVGKTGHHQGFLTGLNKILPDVTAYLAKYDKDSTKVFINGYSRAAAVGDLLAKNLLDNNLAKASNLYAYLFETPRGVDLASGHYQYASIFNIINSSDLITYFAPRAYAFERAGNDIDISKSNAQEILTAFNSKLVLPEFSVNEGNYTNDVEFINYILNSLLEPLDEEHAAQDMSTRGHYVDNAQDSMGYFIALMLSLPDEVMAAISDSFNGLGFLQMLDLFAEDGMYNHLKPILDEHNVSYDDAKLKSSTNVLMAIGQQKLAITLALVTPEFKGNLKRTLDFHALETVIPLLINY